MKDNETTRLFKFVVALFCATLIFMSFIAANRYGATAETELASEAMPMRSMFVFEDYDPAIDEVGHKVDFGEGYFFLKGDIETYIEGNVLNFRRMAEDHGHIDDFGSVAGEEITADMVPESGSSIAIHGARSDSDYPYMHAGIFAPICVVNIVFHDSPEDRTLVLEDGSHISPLMAKVILYYLETSHKESMRTKARFLHLKQWGESANTDIEVLYNPDTELVTWDGVDSTPIVTMGDQFRLGESS